MVDFKKGGGKTLYLEEISIQNLIDNQSPFNLEVMLILLNNDRNILREQR